ncbi:hypothetical protein MiSe_37140 [Microseira wollei NIES-4236]|uniref:Uncharacterized protein n=1 Tax=Microseira wollei NIES-4236 TaxID=2530354 RepID=A0AAV3XEU1_9CYAN|nr:hypothetical protein MiSe_37140 [Microseira wollei NIES-4236]
MRIFKITDFRIRADKSIGIFEDEHFVRTYAPGSKNPLRQSRDSTPRIFRSAFVFLRQSCLSCRFGCL